MKYSNKLFCLSNHLSLGRKQDQSKLRNDTQSDCRFEVNFIPQIKNIHSTYDHVFYDQVIKTQSIKPSRMNDFTSQINVYSTSEYSYSYTIRKYKSAARSLIICLFISHKMKASKQTLKRHTISFCFLQRVRLG